MYNMNIVETKTRLTQEAVEKIIGRDHSRCIVCGKADTLSVLPLTPHANAETLNEWATLCSADAEAFASRRIRILGSPDAWMISQFDGRQWILVPAFGGTITSPGAAEKTVQVMRKVVGQLYRTANEEAAQFDEEKLKEMLLSLEENALEAFKLKCYIAHLIMERRRISLRAAYGNFRDSLENLENLLEGYSSEYIYKLSLVWRNLLPYWERFSGKRFSVNMLMHIALSGDVDNMVDWALHHYSIWNREPSLRDFRLAREQKRIGATTDQEKAVKSCRLCRYLNYSKKGWGLLLVNGRGSPMARTKTKHEPFCMKYHRLLRMEAKVWDSIANDCPGYTPRALGLLSRPITPKGG